LNVPKFFALLHKKSSKKRNEKPNIQCPNLIFSGFDSRLLPAWHAPLFIFRAAICNNISAFSKEKKQQQQAKINKIFDFFDFSAFGTLIGLGRVLALSSLRQLHTVISVFVVRFEVLHLLLKFLTFDRLAGRAVKSVQDDGHGVFRLLFPRLWSTLGDVCNHHLQRPHQDHHHDRQRVFLAGFTSVVVHTVVRGGALADHPRFWPRILRLFPRTLQTPVLHVAEES